MSRIVLAEDSVLLREGLVALLRGGGDEVVAAVGRADEIAGAVAEHEPDLLITDVRMPVREGFADAPGAEVSGLAAALEIRRDRPDLPILVLSQYVAAAYAAQLIDSAGRAGLGYLLKQRIADVAEFRRTVSVVLAGGTVIDPDVLQTVLADARRNSPLLRLTPREREVLACVARGLSNAQIAAELVVGAAAVEKHLGNVFDKLGLTADDGNRRVRAVLAYLKG
ncbi:response regulator transcription factor [Naumannella cuiyingiana]|uniref:DNA-binding NarL/FixJ family response regulator n=1 Tax=Naumannella cuiyingiana TaxID=1347891 RepID=A0A7Z0IJF6_9ACTN|nr:response regulator transcription factor [Naumannella cuiyingiana]NYI69484.1 DNA-binding NarL/FixJ family response regulator [Naumannella cuiyingiana]